MLSKFLKMGAFASLVSLCAVSNAESIEGDLYLSGSLNAKGKGNTFYNGLRVNTGETMYNSIRLTTEKNWAMISAYGYNGWDPMAFVARKYNFTEGKVGIGVENPTAELDVNGSIKCTGALDVVDLKTKNINSSSIMASEIKANDIRMDMNNVADYVFAEDYDLKSLSEVENYVNEHKHLPGVPSAAEMEAEGMSVAKMSNLLLEKVEELTLHMIELKKENAALKIEMENMKNNLK